MENILLGKPSEESQHSFERWLEKRKEWDWHVESSSAGRRCHDTDVRQGISLYAGKLAWSAEQTGCKCVFEKEPSTN